MKVLHLEQSFVRCWNLHIRIVDQKYLEGFEMCWRRMEKISWTDRARNEEMWQREKEEINFAHTIKRREANWIGHILGRNWLLKHVIEGKMEVRIGVKGVRGRRRKEPLDDPKEKRGNCKLKEETLHRTLWRTLFGRGFVPVISQTT